MSNHVTTAIIARDHWTQQPPQDPTKAPVTIPAATCHQRRKSHDQRRHVRTTRHRETSAASTNFHRRQHLGCSSAAPAARSSRCPVLTCRFPCKFPFSAFSFLFLHFFKRRRKKRRINKWRGERCFDFGWLRASTKKQQVAAAVQVAAAGQHTSHLSFSAFLYTTGPTCCH